MPRQPNVLIVDDDEPSRTVVRVNMELEGYVVREAADGDSGLRMAQAVRPDVIVLDLRMPHRQGLDVLAELRSDSELHAVPVVVLTGTADESTELRAMELGAVSYVAKPVDVDDLLRIVRGIVNCD